MAKQEDRSPVTAVVYDAPADIGFLNHLWMRAGHTSTGSVRTGAPVALRPVHPELVEGWCVPLLSTYQIGSLYINFHFYRDASARPR